MADPEPLVLGIDTASLVSVAVARGTDVLARRVLADPRGHVEHLTPLIGQACAAAGIRPHELARVVVGLGPGPFTGLRVGIVTAEMVAAVTGAELRGVCSLDVIAAGHDSDEAFLVAADARRTEVYWATYDRSGQRIDGPRVSAPAELPDLPAVGPAVEIYPELLHGVPGPRALDPGLLATRGWLLPDAGSAPLYLRRPDATESTRRKSVLARPSLQRTSRLGERTRRD